MRDAAAPRPEDAEAEADDGGGGGPAALPGPGAGLPRLIRALRGAGLDPDWAGVADALWLAQYSHPSAAPDAPGADRPAGEGGGARLPGTDPAQGAPAQAPGGARRPPGPDDQDDPGAGPGRAPGPGDETVGLYADPAGSGETLSTLSALPRDALRVGVPEARALPGLLELERALRPLQRYRPPARPPRAARRELDERATVERTAEAGGLLLPAFHEPSRGQIELQLLMDAASAMRVWQRMLGELTDVFARLGAFRDIQVHHLHESPDGSPAISRRFERDEEPRASTAALHPVRQLQDPTGRRLTVMVSDCAGPLWRSGAAHRLLYGLSRHGQVAVVQPLPQRLWARTRLPVSYGTLLREEGPAGSARLRFAAADPRQRLALGGAPGPGSGTVPVPVLPPAAAALGAWAGLLAGPGAGSARAAVGWARADQPAAAPAGRRPAGQRNAAQLLGRFRSTTSPGAAQLAVYLAAAPLFLPVMQLVQRTMLPDSGPAELSEVMLSGLLRRREGTEGRWYEFADGVHEQLLGALGHDEALLVLKHCSGYVEQRFGRAGPNFPALALAQLTGISPPEAPDAAEEPAATDPTGAGSGPGRSASAPGGRVPQPFAEVAAKVLRRFLPEIPPEVPPVSLTRGVDPAALPVAEAVGQARSLAARFADDGRVRHLMEAVRLLRQAAQGQRAPGQVTDPEVWSELAELLLRLWREQRDGELLREARQAAATAAAPPGSVRARTVLARVLHETARERRAAGDARGALELWRLADREFAAVCATPGLGAHEALGPALERVQVLEEQWRLGGDTGLLQESVGMLEAIADAWPEGEPVPSGLPLAHGRALLRLAGAELDAERARANAEQAAASLELGCRTLLAESAPPRRAARALLDQVDALLLTARDWPRAGAVIAQARKASDDPGVYGACLIRSGRLHLRRFAEDGSPGELAAAAQRFAGASRLVTRDRPQYSALLEEWGETLLRRAGLPDGDPFVSQAVRVLRDCRMETPADDPRLPDRLLLLGRALAARYRQATNLVDLREAEYLFTRAARGAEEPLTRAWAWFELGETHRRAHGHTKRHERLELAAEAYRQAASAAGEAEREAADPEEAVRLAASALQQRGVVYETAQRPLAAGEAYRAATAKRLTLRGDATP
jgi:tetratricopeptide (TPR) repeat protein